MFGRFSTSAASLLPRPCFRPLFWQLGLMYAVKPKEIFRRVEQPAVIQRPCEMTGRSLPSGAGAKVQSLWLDQADISVGCPIPGNAPRAPAFKASIAMVVAAPHLPA